MLYIQQAIHCEQITLIKWFILIQKDLQISVKFKSEFESDSVNYSEPLLSSKIILNRETLVIKYYLF